VSARIDTLPTEIKDAIGKELCYNLTIQTLLEKTKVGVTFGSEVSHRMPATVDLTGLLVAFLAYRTE
jgi:hypothetical protein